jgi:hypothetical protein
MDQRKGRVCERESAVQHHELVKATITPVACAFTDQPIQSKVLNAILLLHTQLKLNALPKPRSCALA